ncbi:hypothetical protein FB45DRAFT_842644 [Roridomyces roridus]|uniref:Proteophosphoglycan 5 n=1 Tax=Roridomyces roridus TaxID=1738132 RepID=A0AAD7B8N2_9AGAR|nr:hypothetical protein FB45DRAFT_842644 [Roridomyces roridus]
MSTSTPNPQLLRSRSTSFGNLPKEAKFTQPTNPPAPQTHYIRRRGICKLLLLFTLILFLAATLFYYKSSPEAPSQVLVPPPKPLPRKIDSISPRPDPPSKNPTVDRSVLQKLAKLEISPDPDERPYSAKSLNRPPIVTRIPEPKKSVVNLDACGGNAKHCRFLLPLRVFEQESKARIHFMDLLQIAQKLDRILVLPNVGKSRMGACYKSDFEMYYDLERLTAGLDVPHTFVKQHVFRRWANAAKPSAQLVFVSADSPPNKDPPLFQNDDLTARVGAPDNQLDLLPACYAKFHALRLDRHAPLHIDTKEALQTFPIHESILTALTRPELQAAAFIRSTESETPSDPTVLVVTWDLRSRIFPPNPALPRLHYSPRLHDLAAFFAPPAPYAMVHWRMETVSPAALPDCAHALVDTLSRLGSSSDESIRRLWFASDYPYAVHRRALPGVDYSSTSQSEDVKAKSGTFRDLGPLHAEAVGILGDALAEGGELESWEVAELTEARLAAIDYTVVGQGRWPVEELEDSGVRGILDKIIGMKAALFVSGGEGCARSSSFTRQIVSERRARFRANEVQNLVERFGYGDLERAAWRG